MNSNYQNTYKILNLPRSADWQQAKTQYRRLVQTCHPDKFDSDSVESLLAHEKFLEINNAYELLQNFYRENQKLPLQPDRLSDSDFVELQQKQTAQIAKNSSSRKRSREKTSKGTASKLSYALGLAMVIFLLFNSSRESSGPMSIEGNILVDDYSLNARSSGANNNWNNQLGGDLSRGRILGTSQPSVGDSLNGRLFERHR